MGVVNPIKVEDNLSVVAIIGQNMRYQPGIAARMFSALGRNGVNAVAIAQGSSELNISVVIPRADETKALNALHEAYFLSDTKELHLFIVGVGLIGGTLLEQIKQQASYLKEKNGLEIKVVGLSNSKRMIFNADGIDLDNWKEELLVTNDKADLPIFIGRMKEMNLSNCILIENTASPSIPN